MYYPTAIPYVLILRMHAQRQRARQLAIRCPRHFQIMSLYVWRSWFEVTRGRW